MDIVLLSYYAEVGWELRLEGQWHRRRIIGIDPRPVWMAGLWCWLLPALAVMVTVRARAPWEQWNWLVDGLAFYLAATVLGGVAAWGYSRRLDPAGGLLLIQEGTRLQHCGMASAAGSFLVPSFSFGWGMGLLTRLVTGPLVSAGGWNWAVILLAFPLATYGAALVGLWLYNRIVVPFYGSLSWQEAPEAKNRVRITTLDPREVRLVTALWAFSWTVLLLLLVVIALLVGMTVWANRLPVGYFSLGVSIFAGFFLAGIGFLVSVGLGYWAAWGARLYNRWARRGGGFRWTLDSGEAHETD